MTCPSLLNVENMIHVADLERVKYGFNLSIGTHRAADEESKNSSNNPLTPLAVIK